MNNLKNKFIVAALLCAVTILFSNCRRDKIIGTFTVKGYLLDSCGGTPQHGIPLQVSFQSDKTMTGSKKVIDDNVGRGLTDAKGYFELRCLNYLANGKFNLFNSANKNIYLQEFDYPYPTDGVLDAGVGYTKGILFKGDLKISLLGAFLPEDTLYVGSINDNDFFTNLYDGKQVIVVKKQIEPTVFLVYRYPTMNEKTIWAIGFADFKAGKNKITFAINKCNMPDTITNITISK